MVKVLSHIYLVVEGCHFLLVVHQFLLVDPLNVFVYVLQFLELVLQVLEGDRFGQELSLEFLVLVGQAADLNLELFIDLVHFHTFDCLQLVFLPVHFCGQLAADSSSIQGAELVFLVFFLQIVVELLDVLIQTSDILFQLFADVFKFVLFPFFFLLFTFQLSLSISPLSLLNSEIFFN